MVATVTAGGEAEQQGQLGTDTGKEFGAGTGFDHRSSILIGAARISDFGQNVRLTAARGPDRP